MLNCPHASDDLCLISTTLAHLPVTLDENACRVCQESDLPMDLNSVVCSRAIHFLRKAGLPIEPSLFNCVREAQKEGPGTELKNLLSIWSEPEESCNCNTRIAQMNQWGQEGCITHFETIVDWIHSEAQKKVFLLKYLPCRWYFSRLVRKAIKNAGRTRLRNQSKNKARPEGVLIQ